jgi:hypothetical protein
MITGEFSHKRRCYGFYDEKIARAYRKFRKILNDKSIASDSLCDIFRQITISSIARCNA